METEKTKEKTEKANKKSDWLRCRVEPEIAQWYKQKAIEQGTTVSNLMRYQLMIMMPQKS